MIPISAKYLRSISTQLLTATPQEAELSRRYNISQQSIEQMPPLSTYTLTDRAPLRAHKVKLQPFASPPAQEVKPIIDDRIAKLRDFASLLESRMASLPCVADYNVIVAACRELIATLQNVSMQEIQVKHVLENRPTKRVEPTRTC
jgi:hypothetical protein